MRTNLFFLQQEIHLIFGPFSLRHLDHKCSVSSNPIRKSKSSTSRVDAKTGVTYVLGKKARK